MCPYMGLIRLYDNFSIDFFKIEMMLSASMTFNCFLVKFYESVFIHDRKQILIISEKLLFCRVIMVIVTKQSEFQSNKSVSIELNNLW